MWRADSFEKTLMLGKIEGRRRRGRQRMRRLDGITDTMDMGLGGLWEVVMDREAWRAVVHRVTKSQTRLSGWTEVNFNCTISQSLFSLHIPADYVEHLFIYLLTIYISSFMNYLFRTFAYFYSGLFVFLSLSCRNSSYSLIMNPLSVTCIVDFSSQSFHSLNDTFWWIVL